MNEYVSEAIVLEKDPQGELDERVSVFTKRFGKFSAKVKSSRKITSKLSPHLEPGNLIRVRLVEKGNLQIVDALKSERLNSPPAFFYLLNRILAEGEPDTELWKALISGEANWKKILGILGWDPMHASCENCGRPGAASFHLASQSFFCGNCGSSARGETVLV
ncbi:MAG: recombination protein O N-terminal domain-containing protein [Candidatus Liptonbacteria bacterium]|nr:recombination protein O N-terminal domain-containing protein [Candidatus Liptonbacteria bacterium]